MRSLVERNNDNNVNCKRVGNWQGERGMGRQDCYYYALLALTRSSIPPRWRRRCSSCVNLQTGERWWVDVSSVQLLR